MPSNNSGMNGNVSIGPIGNNEDIPFVHWLESTVFPSLAKKDNGYELLGTVIAYFFEDEDVDVGVFEFPIEHGKPLYDSMSEDEKAEVYSMIHSVDLGDYVYGNGVLPVQGGSRRRRRRVHKTRKARKTSRRHRRHRSRRSRE